MGIPDAFKSDCGCGGASSCCGRKTAEELQAIAAAEAGMAEQKDVDGGRGEITDGMFGPGNKGDGLMSDGS